MTTLTRTPRAPRQEVNDQSGITTDEWALMSADMAWRGVICNIEDATIRDDKLKRLDALLDDPEIAKTYGKSTPERTKALTRHVELWGERKRYWDDAAKSAKDLSYCWNKLNAVFRDCYPKHIVSVWKEDNVLLALSFMERDPKLKALPIWQVLFDAVQESKTREPIYCPF